MQIIAYLSMFIDHISKFALNGKAYIPLVGRLAMPIFAFLVAMGMKRTKSKEKYILRMLVFAVISQIPFILMIYGRFALQQTPIMQPGEYTLMYINYYTRILNIGFTFLIALLSIYFIDKNKNNLINKIIILVLSLFLAEELNTDYGMYGLITVLIFYYIENKLAITISYLAITTYSVFEGSFTTNANTLDYFYIKLRSYFSILALPIIFYLKEITPIRKKREITKFQKKLYRILKYSIYPIHMLLIYLYRIYF